MAQEKNPRRNPLYYSERHQGEFPGGTLNQILSPKQAGLGKQGLLRLIDKYGLQEGSSLPLSIFRHLKFDLQNTNTASFVSNRPQ
jgi:hypothetical protein